MKFKGLSLVALSGLMALFVMTSTAHAQIVNSGPGSPNANSQVTLKATIPNMVNVQVNNGTSVITATVPANLIDSASNVPSTDFQLRGNVKVNKSGANVQCTLSATTLELANGADTLTVNLSGTIGGQAIDTDAFTPTFTSKQAAINIDGDIDESTVTSADEPGDYTGTLTITANLI